MKEGDELGLGDSCWIVGERAVGGRVVGGAAVVETVGAVPVVQAHLHWW